MANYRSVNELTADELTELKQNRLTEILDEQGECPSYDELASADELISDEDIKEYYSDYAFVDEDFFCNVA